MALRDTSWITGPHAIVESFSPVASQIVKFPKPDGTLVTWSRTTTRVKKVWVALTYAAAVAYANAHTTDTGAIYDVQEDVRQIGSYTLLVDSETTGEWTEAP